MAEKIMEYIESVGGVSMFEHWICDYGLSEEIIEVLKEYKKKGENQGLPPAVHKLIMSILYI